MKEYSHIEKYEKALDLQEEKLKELNEVLAILEENLEEYQELMRYYYSDQWKRDFEDDENGRIPQDLKRGVLSEDGIYHVLAESYSAAIRMLELATKYLKNE